MSDNMTHADASPATVGNTHHATWDDVRAGGKSDIDLDEVRRALELFTDQGPAFEVRGLHGPGKAHGKVCTTIEDGIAAAVDCDRCLVTWLVLNPIRADARSATKATVVRRRWFLVDVDTVHPDNCSSSDDEKAAAGDVMGRVADYLAGLGWPEPVVDDSGNGWHLLYRLDLPNDEMVYQTIRKATVALADRFDCDEAKIDRRTFDAPRCCKLPGTWVRKDPELPGRPHRMARIVRAPASVGVVTYEQLAALARDRPVPSSPQAGLPLTDADRLVLEEQGYPVATPPPDPGTTNGHPAAPITWGIPHTADARAAKIVATAIRGESDLVANAVAGGQGGKGRNNQLNDSAVALGSLAHWPEMNEARAKDELTRAACRAGLDVDNNCGPAGIAATIESSWNYGMTVPRPRPDAASANGNGKANGKVNGKANLGALGRLTIMASEVEPEDVSWLWPDVLALGFINLFAGRTGVGKSFALTDVASRLSTGRAMPDGSPARPVNGTLLISEDPIRQVLIPRLIALGADRDRVGFLRWKAMAQYELSDVDLLQQAWEELRKPELIVIDPPANFLGSKDEHKNSEVRSVLMKLVEWLENKPVAMALITHYNKGGAAKALDALDRIMGSVAWASSARVACGFMADPDDAGRGIFGGIKNNLGPKAGPLSYRIVPTGKSAKVEWLGVSKTTLEDAMHKKSRGACAVEWLTKMFRLQPEYESEKLKDMARQEGVSKNALWSAEANALPIDKMKRTTADGDTFYVWRARSGWPATQK